MHKVMMNQGMQTTYLTPAIVAVQECQPTVAKHCDFRLRFLCTVTLFFKKCWRVKLIVTNRKGKKKIQRLKHINLLAKCGM